MTKVEPRVFPLLVTRFFASLCVRACARYVLRAARCVCVGKAVYL